MRYVIILAAGLAGIAAQAAPAQEIVGRRETTFNISKQIASGSWVRIASPNGSITISEGTGDQVQVRADKVVGRRGSVEDVGFVVRQESGSVTICAVYEDADECDSDGGYHGRSRRWREGEQVRTNFTVRIPSGAKVKAGTGNGDVAITGGGNEVHASTGNGRINVSGTTGEVEASTGNGRITIENARGPVEASTGNGDVQVTTSLGPVTASSGNGDIDVAMDRLDRSSDMEFSTGNGRVTVTVPETFGAELNADTGSGHVLVDFPLELRGRIDPSKVHGKLGGGGGRLTMSSGNGDLVVRRRP